MLSVAVLLIGAAVAPPQSPPVDPAGIAGALLVCGGGELPKAVRARFVELAGGDAARIVLVPTAASSDIDAPGGLADCSDDWPPGPAGRYQVLHTRQREVADSEAFCAPLRQATGVWFGGGQQSRLADVYLGTRFERELQALVRRGGVVGGTSAGAAIQSRQMIAGGNPEPELASGFDLVPDAIVDQHFLKRGRLERLRRALHARPGCFGLGVDESTAVEIRGRRIAVLGDSKAVLLLAAAGGRDERLVELDSGDVADLPSWQRAARARAAGPWPPTPMPAPRVPDGALLLAGGGRLPAAVVERFVALAGGAVAKVVIVPTASGDDPPRPDPIAAQLRAAGITDLRVLHARHPQQLDAAHLAVLADATAVWFGGGRQWRLCDTYDGTPALAAFHAVLARGGVIGGSSAGATIQAGFLVRGDPLGNAAMWCEGYERGFGFLPGCAVDQHFFTRRRQADMAALVQRLPQLLGIGIDEGTALVVQGTVGEVIGDSRVAFYDRRRLGDGKAQAAAEPLVLGAGERLDLPSGERLPPTGR